MKKRQTIIKSDYAIVEEVIGADTFKYWLYEITPIKTWEKDGMKFATGGFKHLKEMYKTIDEALDNFELINQRMGGK